MCMPVYQRRLLIVRVVYPYVLHLESIVYIVRLDIVLHRAINCHTPVYCNLLAHRLTHCSFNELAHGCSALTQYIVV